MKISALHLILPAIVAGIIASSCTSRREAVTATPAPVVVMPDTAGRVDLNVEFNVPQNYISKRSRLVIMPTLVVADTTVEEYDPLVVDAPIFRKKTHRKEVLEGYVDPWAHRVQEYGGESYLYQDSIYIPKGLYEGRIVAVVSNDGCGQCTGLDTIDVAEIINPVNFIDTTTSIVEVWMDPEFEIKPKIHDGKGEARLQFVVNKWDIVPDLANNRVELDTMLASLRPIIQDSLATLTSLNIFGSASAEASYQYNVKLANNRANSAKNWLAAQLELPRAVKNIIKVGASPEGWEPVVQAMRAANDPDSILVRELMIKYPGPTDDAAEKYIRKLKCWPRIRDNYLAKDRKVLYNYTWEVKSFTDDAELIEMYSKRPDAFSEEEFLRVASLAKDDDSREMVYEKILEYYPDSEVANNNLKVLQNRRRYAIGKEKAQEWNFAEAYELLKPFGDINAAVSAIALGKLDEADEIMQKIDDDSPSAEEVRSLIVKLKELKK